ncbi:MAG: S26 family signal peptidase [Actinobacteria bacterium]|nr:S26 family signal peptidase [Actinomycetota bacterium]
MSRFGTVRVVGGSMAPTYKDGAWLLVRWFTNLPERNFSTGMIGKIYVIEKRERPGIFLVKRLKKVNDQMLWVEGDSQSSTDSRQWGWIYSDELVGQVIFTLKK